MADPIRAALEQAAHQLINEHVPRLFRSRALEYLPLALDRLTAAVESVREAADYGR